MTKTWNAALVLSGLMLSLGASAQGIPERGNRFEGLVALPISGTDRPSLDLLSFTGFFEPFSGSVDLRVRFFLPVAPARVRIVAQELTQDRFYRMESKPAAWTPKTWSVFGPWPAGDVIVPGNVLPSNIGVVVYLDDAPEGRALIAPAVVEHGATVATITRYRMQLRPVRTSLSTVDYTLERVEPLGLVPVAAQKLAVERPEGRPFRIDLDAAGLPEGRFLLTITGHVKNSTTLKLNRQYEFEHRQLAN